MFVAHNTILMKKALFYVLLAGLIVIQFIRPPKNTSTLAQENDIAVKTLVPDQVQVILRKACYDCHSNTTNYPWYANIQPVYWWLDHHVREGKDELNFSEFGAYTVKRKIKKYTEIAREVTEGKMPLDSYTWTHKDAKLSKDEAQLLINWANAMAYKTEQESVKMAIVD